MTRVVVGTIGEGLLELALRPGEDIASVGFGGDTANVAVMAAKLGVPARLLTRVGRDEAGRRLIEFWSACGVDCAALRIDDVAPTGIYVNTRSATGEMTFDYHRSGSAGSLLAPGDVTAAFVDDLAILHLSGITLAISRTMHDAAERAVALACERGIPLSVAVNYRPGLAMDLVAVGRMCAQARYVFLSHEDALALAGSTDAQALQRQLVDARCELVLTAGAGDALVIVGEEVHRVAPPRVEQARDTAGAGDAVAGTYLAARLKGHDPVVALSRGVWAASLSVGAWGCARSYPTAEELDWALDRGDLTASVT